MINFDNRLKSLKDRRQGVDVRMAFESTARDSIGFDLRSKENYENLRESSSIKYTIGAMAPVEKRSTEISIKEGKRIADSLIKSLKEYNINATSRLQGSVALDIHIKGHSDVDMLIIITDTETSELPRVYPQLHIPATDKRTMEDIVKDLRLTSEIILPKNFPQVNINNNGNKAIALEGGSLQRKVDIVPSCWYNTRMYQQTKLEKDRGIKIYLKTDHELLANLPFLHIDLISNKDTLYSGNLRNCIRLMKNMVADMPDYKKRIAKKLSSYDLASIAYHMNEKLSLPYEMRIGLVEQIKEHLNHLSTNSYQRNILHVPDKSRIIFNNEDKVKALEIIKEEFNDLATSIFNDLSPFSHTYNADVILNKRVA